MTTDVRLAEVIQIHLLGRPATGDLKRPFKAGGLMGAALVPAAYRSPAHCLAAASSEAQTDQKAIKEAEKAQGKTTKKEL